MVREVLDENYIYQINDYGIVHLFRGEEDCQHYLIKPLLSAIFKIETLKKENEELKAQVEQLSNDNHVLKTAFITQSEQIEKMKCCGNCDKNAYCEKEHYGNDKGCEDW